VTDVGRTKPRPLCVHAGLPRGDAMMLCSFAAVLSRSSSRLATGLAIDSSRYELAAGSGARRRHREAGYEVVGGMCGSGGLCVPGSRAVLVASAIGTCLCTTAPER
jgi:hypothetical protein